MLYCPINYLIDNSTSIIYQYNNTVTGKYKIYYNNFILKNFKSDTLGLYYIDNSNQKKYLFNKTSLTPEGSNIINCLNKLSYNKGIALNSSDISTNNYTIIKTQLKLLIPKINNFNFINIDTINFSASNISIIKTFCNDIKDTKIAITVDKNYTNWSNIFNSPITCINLLLKDKTNLKTATELVHSLGSNYNPDIIIGFDTSNDSLPEDSTTCNSGYNYVYCTPYRDIEYNLYTTLNNNKIQIKGGFIYDLSKIPSSPTTFMIYYSQAIYNSFLPITPQPETPIYAVYIGDDISNSQTITKLNDSSFNTIIITSCHIGRGTTCPDFSNNALPAGLGPVQGQKTGDIIFNTNPALISNNVFTKGYGNILLQNIKSLSNKTLSWSFGGGGGIHDYELMYLCFGKNKEIDKSSILYKNFETLFQTFNMVKYIDIDCEEFTKTTSQDYHYNYQNIIINFAKMCSAIGFKLSLSIYDYNKQINLVVAILQNLNKDTKIIEYVTLQTYFNDADAKTTDPIFWTHVLNTKLIDLNPLNIPFIVSGFQTGSDGGVISDPSDIQCKLYQWNKFGRSFKNGFIWRYSYISNNIDKYSDALINFNNTCPTPAPTT